MSKKEAKPTKKKGKPRVHKDLSGFEIAVDQFGEIKSNMAIDQINLFLNENVDDKKLVDRNEDEPVPRKQKRKK